VRKGGAEVMGRAFCARNGKVNDTGGSHNPSVGYASLHKIVSHCGSSPLPFGWQLFAVNVLRLARTINRERSAMDWESKENAPWFCASSKGLGLGACAEALAEAGCGIW